MTNDKIEALKRLRELLEELCPAKSHWEDLGPLLAVIEAPEHEAIPQSGTKLGWAVRERRNTDGELLDCFVEAPRESGMAYGLEVLGDDYTGYGDVERKLTHCKMIVDWANGVVIEKRDAQQPTAATVSEQDKRDAGEACEQLLQMDSTEWIAGDLTAQELRAVRAILRCLARAVRGRTLEDTIKGVGK